jgi:hypothetical protein
LSLQYVKLKKTRTPAVILPIASALDLQSMATQLQFFFTCNRLNLHSQIYKIVQERSKYVTCLDKNKKTSK